VERTDSYRRWIAAASIFTGALLVRAWPVAAIDSYWEDAYFYIELARSLWSGSWSLAGQFHTKYLPGYPAAIAATRLLTAGTAGWFLSAQLVSALASAAAAALCFLLVRELTGELLAGVAAGLMAGLNSHLVVWGGIPFSESLFAFQVVLAIYLLGRTPLCAGAVVGWAIVTRHEGWFLLIALAAAAVASSNRRRLAGGAAIAAAIGAGWWILCHLETGSWLYDVYIKESAERGPEMGRSGLGFLLQCFPVAGHLATLLALCGLWPLAKRVRGRPIIAFAAPYLALHAWWMFPVERYMVPMVPLACIAAGCGLHALAGLLIRSRGRGAVRRAAVPALGLIAGASHFIGFAPEMVREEAGKVKGYAEAVEWVGENAGDFSVLAYDAFMAGYHGGKAVIPSGWLSGPGWEEALVRLYAERNLRYVIWSDLYPSDRAKGALGSGERIRIGSPGPGGAETVTLVPVFKRYWIYRYPRSGWYVPWRRIYEAERKAIVYRLARER